MGLRFRKSVKIAPGIKVNFGKKGAGVSFGGKGCRYSISSSGRRTATFGIPGTGLSYSTSSGGSKKRRSSTHRKKGSSKSNQAAAKQKAIEQKNNASIVEEYNSYMFKIKSLHTECEPEIKWNDIKSSNAPFISGEVGPNEKIAVQKFNDFNPTFIEKIFCNNGEKRKKKLEDNIPEAHKQDCELYEEWEDSVKFSERVLSGDIESFYEVIEESNPFDQLVDWGSGFEFGTDNPNYMEVEFEVKSKDVIPSVSKTLTKTGKISEKALSKTAYYDYTQDYVCSCSIRIARELFAILPINTVIVHATDTILDSSTGTDSEQTILSVKFERSGFQNIDFNRIDASDFTERFQHNMNFKKTSGFLPIDRLSY